MRPRIVVFSGGQEEHAGISSQSGKWLCQYIPRSQYDVVPVEVTHEGKWKVPLGSLPKTGPVGRTMDMLSSVTQPLAPSDALDRLFSKPVDSIITVLRGKGGDDGALHSMGALLGIRVAGSNHHTARSSSHKHQFAHSISDIAATPYSHLVRHTMSAEEIESELRGEFMPPFFIKPVHSENSHGIVRVDSLSHLRRAIESAKQHSQDFIVQEHAPGLELTVTVYMDQKGAIHALPPTIVTPKGSAFYDYHTKQRDGAAQFHTVHSSDKSLAEQAEEIARDVYESLSCQGVATVDMIADAGAIDVLELNTIPTFHPASPILHQLKEAGLHPEDLIRQGYLL